jgi:hypothetical protein
VRDQFDAAAALILDHDGTLATARTAAGADSGDDCRPASEISPRTRIFVIILNILS